MEVEIHRKPPLILPIKQIHIAIVIAFIFIEETGIAVVSLSRLVESRALLAAKLIVRIVGTFSGVVVLSKRNTLSRAQIKAQMTFQTGMISFLFGAIGNIARWSRAHWILTASSVGFFLIHGGDTGLTGLFVIDQVIVVV